MISSILGVVMSSGIAQWLIAAGVAMLGALAYGWRKKRQGAAEQMRKQQEANAAANARAEVADREYRESGGAKDRLRKGDF